MLTVEDILKEAVRRNASDVIISAGSPVSYHVYGRLEPHDPNQRLTPDESRELAYQLLNDEQRKIFEEELEGDMSFELFEVSRFRVNVYQQRGSVSAVLRLIPLEIPNYNEIGISDDLIQRMAGIPNGLMLVTGPTGSGKSTTCASFIKYLNEEHDYPRHIVTIEDPIEFRMRSGNCIIDQREVGVDTKDYPTGLKGALRQMAHIIFVGEMRDRKTIEIALTAAETGNLVISTLATQSAAKTINRIIDVFPISDQDEVRTRLALTLKMVFSQVLLRRADEMGRVAAREALFVTSPVSNMIRENKVHQINNVISSGKTEGMILMDDALLELYQQGLITHNDLYLRLSNKNALGNAVSQT
jgi:twitching motility protein PilT